MPLPIRSVLFLCVANSARSQMAEALARAAFGDRVRVASAGSRPTRVNPLAIQALAEVGLDLSGHHSKLVSTIDPAGVDLVITLCAEEECPAFLGRAERRSWAMPDPDRKHEPLSDAERLQHFRVARDAIAERVEALRAELLGPSMRVGPHRIGGDQPVFLLGPCVLEAEARTLAIGEGIAAVCARLGVPWIFKVSFDKANRSSAAGFRGPGLESGLEALARIKARLGVPLTTDVHLPDQAAAVAEVADLLQVPAFLCRQTDLLVACAATGRPVNVKKGQFMAPEDMAGALSKLRPGRAMLTERGASFGYHNLVVDFRGLSVMRGLGAPVCFDATHAVQTPGSGAGALVTGGDRRFVPGLARAAAAVGIDALFMEVHDRPEESPSDAANMLRLEDLEGVLRQVTAIDEVVRRG